MLRRKGLQGMVVAGRVQPCNQHLVCGAVTVAQQSHGIRKPPEVGCFILHNRLFPRIPKQ